MLETVWYSLAIEMAKSPHGAGRIRQNILFKYFFFKQVV